MKFMVEIRLGNDAMKTNLHVAGALRKIADTIEPEGLGDWYEFDSEYVGNSPVIDINGNNVGKYGAVEEPEVQEVPETLTTTLATGYKIYPDSEDEALVLVGDDGYTRSQMFSVLDPASFREIGQAMIAAADIRDAEIAAYADLTKRITSTRRDDEGMF